MTRACEEIYTQSRAKIPGVAEFDTNNTMGFDSRSRKLLECSVQASCYQGSPSRRRDRPARWGKARRSRPRKRLGLAALSSHQRDLLSQSPDRLREDARVTITVCAESGRTSVERAVARAAAFPRLRYMGSKYRLVPQLAEVFAEIGGTSALDAFSGSGVVAYTLKALGYAVTANDFLNFPSIIAVATIENQSECLSAEDIELICGPPCDDRDFIQSTFEGLYFDRDDRAFLDSAWSHIDTMTGPRRALAISSLVLSAARKQPRGVFTFTNLRYDDGRRDLRLPLREHFRERAAEYNAVVFGNGRESKALCSEVSALSGGHDVVYLDPPYAPPRDDNCYIKRYHFLEGLSVYWRGQQIMEDTLTKKLVKKYTPFSYKHTVTQALREAFKQFQNSTIVLSYSSNAVPDAESIKTVMGEFKGSIEVRRMDYRYSFGTHVAAQRREVSEYLFIGQ